MKSLREGALGEGSEEENDGGNGGLGEDSEGKGRSDVGRANVKLSEASIGS